MADYIDRSAIDAEYVKLKRKAWYDEYAYIDSGIVARLLAQAIDNLPAADVAPVVHGEWVDEEETDYLFDNLGTKHHYVRCSICSRHYSPHAIMHYCPNCGAKMDGGNASDGDKGG